MDALPSASTPILTRSPPLASCNEKSTSPFGSTCMAARCRPLASTSTNFSASTVLSLRAAARASLLQKPPAIAPPISPPITVRQAYPHELLIRIILSPYQQVHTQWYSVEPPLKTDIRRAHGEAAGRGAR